MSEFISGLLANTAMMKAFLAWFITQVIKIIVNIVIYRKLDPGWLIRSGGMPSSHTALVMALAVGVGREDGWGSTLFAIAVVLAAVVMYDAAGVRRAAGQQAEAINRLIRDIYTGTQISTERLKELIGHTPLEVLVGAILGIIIGMV